MGEEKKGRSEEPRTLQQHGAARNFEMNTVMNTIGKHECRREHHSGQNHFFVSPEHDHESGNGWEVELKRGACFNGIALVREFVSEFDCPAPYSGKHEPRLSECSLSEMVPHTFVQSKPSTHVPDDDDISSDCASCMMEGERCARVARLFFYCGVGPRC